MRISLRTLFLLLLVAAAALAQNPNPPIVGGERVYPWARYTYETCFFYQDFISGEYYPAGADIPVYWFTDYLQYSGQHNHDVGNRPKILLFDSPGDGTQSPLGFYSIQNLTNAGGCAHVVGQFPDIAGFYRVQVISPFMGSGWERHIDNSAFVQSRQGNSTTIMRPLESLDFNPDTMKPFNLHDNPQHASLTRWVTYQNKPVFQQIADSYISLQASLPVVPINRDKLDFQRCSLPQGGIADNDYNGTGQMSNWTARNQELHDRGLECDIANPASYISDPVLAAQLRGLLLPAVVANGCRIGAYSADGAPLGSIIDYWNQQPYWHVACSYGAISRNPFGQ